MEDELEFVGGACSCKSGGEPPHSKSAMNTWVAGFLHPGEAHGAHKTRYAARRARMRRGRENRAAPVGMTIWENGSKQANPGVRWRGGRAVAAGRLEFESMRG
jgi:hypothetical protein